jgi:hypothetical protein
MTHRIDPNTLRLAQGIAENRANAWGRRSAISMTTEQAIAVCAALSDLWEVASTGEALAKDVLKVVSKLETGPEQLRMRIHSHNLIDEMKALAGVSPEMEISDKLEGENRE